MKIRLSDHFTYKRLLAFVAPTVVMMIISSVYGIVDGFFVSNYVGDTQFAALNFIMPAVMLPGGIGFLIGTGGSALVAKKIGEGEKEQAGRLFSLLIYTAAILGVVLSTLGILFLRPIAELMGASDLIMEDCILYGRIILIGNTAFILQNTFSSFLVVAEKPQMGLWISVASGVTNMVLDFLFIYLFPRVFEGTALYALLPPGLAGAAIATIIGQFVGAIVPILYFLSSKNKSPLRLGKTSLYPKELLQTFFNGSSEMVTNISVSLMGMIYNNRLMYYAKEDGVSAYGVIMYVNFIFIGFFFGYSGGSAALFSYHYGAKNKSELRNLLLKSTVIVTTASLLMTALSQLLAYPLSYIFVNYDKDLLDMTVNAFRLYSLSFLVCGYNIFASSFFTAMNNGPVSALISLLRTFVLQVGAVFLLPMLMGLDGIWLALTVAELLTLLFSAFFLVIYKKKYGYEKLLNT